MNRRQIEHEQTVEELTAFNAVEACDKLLNEIEHRDNIINDLVSEVERLEEYIIGSYK